jgi:hypothetical protein
MPAVAKDIDLIVESVQSRIDQPVDADTLSAVVAADFKRYDSARIKDFVPALVERDVRDRLLRRRHR